MSRHLSERQMSEWALGERSPGAERHVGECLRCREEVSRAAQALAAFRQSARQWSEDQLRAVAPDAWKTERARPWMAFRSLRWACLLALVLVLAGIAVLRRAQRPAAEDSAAADARLLQQIDADVSQTVPDSMEPLVKLVSWNGGTASASKRN
jgi:predicted anti-sigma-YlaC factor YlaD